MYDENEYIKLIFKAQEQGKVSLFGSHRLYMESKSESAKEKLRSIKNISEPGIIGFSFIGNCYITSKDSKEPTFSELVSIIYPNKKKLDPENEDDFIKANDVMHLMAHTHSKNDFFITLDEKDFIKNGKQQALQKIGILVKTPKEFFELIDRD